MRTGKLRTGRWRVEQQSDEGTKGRHGFYRRKQETEAQMGSCMQASKPLRLTFLPGPLRCRLCVGATINSQERVREHCWPYFWPCWDSSQRAPVPCPRLSGSEVSA